MNRRTIVAMYVAFFSLGFIGNILGPTLPAIRTEFGMSLGQAGVLFGVQFAGSLVATWFGGYLSDIVGRKPLLVAGAAGLCGGVLVFAAATPAASWLLPVGAVLFGAGFGSLDGAANAYINERFGSGSGGVMNRVHAFFGGGSLVSPLVTAAVLATGHTWRIAYAAAALFPTVYLMLIAGEAFPHPRASAHSDPAMGPAKNKGGTRAATSGSLGLVLDRRFLVVASVFFLYVGVEVGVSGWTVTFLEKVSGRSIATASAVLSLFWLAVTVGRFIHERLAEKILYATLMAVGSFGAALALVLVVFGQSAFGVSAGFILTGLFLSGIFPTGLGLAARLFPSAFGTVSGSLIAAGSLGGALLPAVVGLVGSGVGLRPGMAFLLVTSVIMGGLSASMARWEATGQKRKGLTRAS